MEDESKNLERFVRRNMFKAKIRGFCNRYMYIPVLILGTLIMSLAVDAVWPYLMAQPIEINDDFIQTADLEEEQVEDLKTVPPDEIPSRININTADAALFDTLPGIGPVKAKNIVETREKMGGFRSVGDLLNVEGIGEKTLEKISGKLYME